MSSRDLLKDAIQKSGYVSVYAIGAAEGGPITVGISAAPEDMLKIAQRWSWQDLDLMFVAWAPSLDAASKIKRRLEDILDARRIRASWYDVRKELLEGYIETSAAGAGVEVFSEEDRLKRLEAAANRRVGIAGKR